MCETHYYNTTYASGERALVEQIKPCRHRCYESPSWSLKERVPTPYYPDYKQQQLPTDKERRRERRYSDAGRYYQDKKGYSPRRRNSLQASSQPIDIPARRPRRSSTMYEDNYTEPTKQESRRRSDKPIIVERDSRDRSGGHRSSRRESAAVPLGWEALYYGSPSRREDKYKSRDSYLEPGRTATSHRRHSSSPTEFPRSSDDHHHHHRSSSSRRSRHEKPVVTSSSGGPVHHVPVTSADILYGDSPIGSYGSSYHSRTSSSSTAPPAAQPSSLPKGVRWEDEVRKAHNERISSRPRLSRSATISGGTGTGKHLDGEVKGILKTTTNNGGGGGVDNTTTTMHDAGGSSAPAVQPLGDDYYHQYQYRPSSSSSSQQQQGKNYYFEQHMDGMGDRLRSRINTSNKSSSSRPSPFSFLDEDSTTTTATPRAWGEKASGGGRGSRRTTPERFYAEYSSSPDYIW